MAKVIMVQGTTSNAGKSLITAALCRIFARDGFRAAPFKSQNMALNSYITKDGLEMGRAQVMQAEAAGIEPDVRMNPILLKPTGDTGSQVIVMGKVLRDMNAQEYYKHKPDMKPYVIDAYNSLADEYDVIVIEGAGSPAEINLRENDIVNMGMAEMADAPVILVGDIDRGGVFASLAGTMLLFDDEEKARVKGTIINKFRGDVEILRPGLKMLEDITNVQVLGVVPYLHVDIDDEDSLSDRLDTSGVPDLIDIAVIRLPRISNFTDFNMFSTIDGVSLRYVSRPGELNNPDLIILPGSKNTMGDLKWLRQSGFEARIKRHSSEGRLVFGVCGGYQMLCQQIEDPYGVEGGGSMAGLGLLPGKTIFSRTKTTTQAVGCVNKQNGCYEPLFGVPVRGYEIHMGETIVEGAASLTTITVGGSQKPDGCVLDNVAGTYLHGIFDSSELVNALIGILMERKGLDPTELKTVDMKEYKNRQYDILADAVEEALDMNEIYAITGLKR